MFFALFIIAIINQNAIAQPINLDNSPISAGNNITVTDDGLQDKIRSLEEAISSQTRQIEELQNTVKKLEKQAQEKSTSNNTAKEPTAGEIPINDETKLPGPKSLPATAPATTTSKDLYQAGLDALKQGDYAKAQGHFDAFLKQYPKDPLTPNVYYWMGESYYAQANYRKSGELFLKSFQEYPNSGKAPDSLLKLALSLQSAKQTVQACQSFGEVLKRYPNASPSVINRAKQGQMALACQ